MSIYRNALPQLGDQLFLLDGGMETTLIYLDGLELPHFAAFDLLSTREGEEKLEAYYLPFVELARRSRRGLILESPTWRASPDWAEKLGYSLDELDDLNRKSIALLERIRERYQTPSTPMVISGCLGPRGDGYVPNQGMSANEARDYHQRQIDVFAGTAADMIAALTMNTVEEATGIVQAAQAAKIPVVISFTTETDGRLPCGVSLGEAVAAVDAATDKGPIYYMINCAHPDHFTPALTEEPWTRRVRGIRANASRKSHEELDRSTELDAGDPSELGAQYAQLRERFSHLNVLGGCCGTDIRHIESIAGHCVH